MVPPEHADRLEKEKLRHYFSCLKQKTNILEELEQLNRIYRFGIMYLIKFGHKYTP